MCGASPDATVCRELLHAILYVSDRDPSGREALHDQLKAEMDARDMCDFFMAARQIVGRPLMVKAVKHMLSCRRPLFLNFGNSAHGFCPFGSDNLWSAEEMLREFAYHDFVALTVHDA